MVEARQDGGEPLRAGVLVIGGGFAGVGAALAARRSGASVVLIEPRTYLGEELTATLRPWLPRDLAERLEDRLGALGVVAGAGAEVELVPDRLKTALEDRLLEAGVTLRYAARPVGWKGDGVFTVEFAGKAGAFDVVAEAVVDATAQGSVARWLPSCAPRWRAGQALRLWRTLEFKIVDRVALAAGGTGLVVPAALSPAARWHAGHDPHGHVLVEFAVDAPFSPDPGWLGPADLESRGRDLDLAAWLIGNHPAFAGARLAAVAPEPLAPPLWRVGAAGD
ncbi:MAG TPA: FAD-dependent oxidoreductase, partial [Deinococcales bacterium]|nr:FAD-dependent oxidoreductase [Deinococcales bacterium]